MREQLTTPDSVGVAEAAPSRLVIRQVFAKVPAQDVGRARTFYRQMFDLEPYSEHNNHLRYEIDGGYFINFYDC